MKKHLPIVLCTAAILPCSSQMTFAQANMPETPADVKAAPNDAVRTPSGLASKVLTAGTGAEHPSAADTVTVHYSGWTTEGRLFDSSVKRGEPTSFPLNGVIKGWTEGVQLMVEGEKRRFWIPADLAYGENPGGGRPGGMLVFDVELLSIKKAPKPPELTAPADAEKTASGVPVKTVSKGTGSKSPKSEDSVQVHLSLWSGSGELLQSTAQQGGPATIPLDKFRIGGIPDAIKTMVEGEKKVAWIPTSVAFGPNPPPNVPANGLVVEIELLSFKEGVPPPPVPSDVAAVPADAQKTASGLASKILTKGSGKDHPKARDTVTVHYSGWTTDGKLFDSSVTRGEPTSFGLNQVIKGWTEGVQLMVKGEKRRFWIP
ncbi:MAG: FKBP-type peptidylprolyl isomerase, partial [Verrucomicrobia bacterium]|nr:FKBP-type peptidylprolyl isomerase [Verrucomicrobiota bacterium]